MSTKFEFYLCKFIEYCNGNNNGVYSEMFEDMDFNGYGVDYVVTFYHYRLEEIFSVK